MEILINTNPKSRIIIEKGIITKNGLPEGFIITDKNIYENYKNLFYEREFFCISPGEASKNIETYIEILKNLENKDVNTIVAFGGGVVGDIAGFVASTYKRGIKLIQVPSSLLAMVDSSIGGKNGVNLGEKKNYIGTIYQPPEICIDVLFLETLPEKEWKNGFAEIIKYGFIFGKPELNKIPLDIKENKEKIEKIIFDCCKNKAVVVEKDEFDKSYRHVLNFGHTIGHAIEILYNLSHGEAISIGMIKELEIAEKLGIVDKKVIEELKKVLNSVGLPIEFPENLDIEKVLDIMKSDKKGKFKFVFDEKNYDVEVDENLIRSVFYG